MRTRGLRPRRLVAIVVGAVALVAAGCGSPAANEPTQDQAEGVAEELGEREIFAGVNIAIADVPLEDIVFDTFDGGSVTLAEASEAQVLDLLNAIPPINDPVYTAGARASWLSDDDLVLGYVASDGTAWAHPHRILNFHEIVNTELGGEPVAITYCPLCGSGIVFDRRPKDLRHDGVLTFGNSSALYENDMVMVDNETNTYWWQVGGRGIVGNLAGSVLRLRPSMTTSWSAWLSLHPETRVLSNDQGLGRRYDRDPFQDYATRLDAGRTSFPTSEAAFADTRLQPSTRVIGFEVDGAPAAVAVLANQPTVVAVDLTQVVFLDGRGGGALYSTVVNGEPTTFSLIDGAFVDSATASTWNAAGTAVGGPAAGQQLEAVPSRSAYWFSWVSTLDGEPTRIFGPDGER